jgi:ubiquinone/menaquinone biosynthesis C-methylase UbiE
MVTHKYELHRAEEILGEISVGNILDVATGNGAFITFLLDHLKGLDDITGIDSNARALQAASSAFPAGNFHFLQMDASAMDFAEGAFDMVCISNSLHHMNNLPGVLSEMKRVCRSGGYFIVSEMYSDLQSNTQQTHVALHHWWAAVDTAEGITHHETYTRQEVIDIIRTIGLSAMRYFDMSDLETNPKDPELLGELNRIIDRYIQRAGTLPSQVELQQRGESLRQRMNQVGFHGATTLLALGRK